jgi:aryl-alcohol dehydrogenase-like predicted oxidoreductase
MRKRTLGTTDLDLSVVGLGTWAMGGPGWRYAWGPQDDAQSIRAIHRALDLGINWIDTAPVYGLGHSEEVVGRALNGMREKPIVATKCGRFANPDGSLFSRIRRESIQREVDESLQRLRLERIDLYQIHWPNPETDLEEAWQVLADLVRQGKIRHAAVSNFNPAQMRRLIPFHPIASLQAPYSLLRRELETEILPFCEEHRIGVVVYSPLQKGLLTGTFSEERAATLPTGDHRRQDPMFSMPELGRILRFVDRIRTVAKRAGMTISQLAIAWTIRLAGVTAAIVGARSGEQIGETVAAGTVCLSDSDLADIQSALADGGV